MEKKISLAIVDDHEMFRSGLKLILHTKEDLELVIEAVNGKDFLDQLEYVVPDVVLLDLDMPVFNGYETAKRALDKCPDLKIIVLSMHSDQEYYYKMIEVGACGFILKNSGVEELFRAINEVAIGNNYFEQQLLKDIVLKINNKTTDTKLKLNQTEKEVLFLICKGYTIKEMSEKMFLSPKTIEKYRSALLHKTNTRNSAHLVMQAISDKLIEL